jgi:Asp-tRNA(Asn)/Glu-tRNA(Gln) amidotransferase A subunit family amidase
MRSLLRIALVAATAFGLTRDMATSQQPTTDGALDVTEASITELQLALNAGTITSVQLVDAYLARIAAYDQAGPKLNAMLRLNPNARAEAARLDAERGRGSVRGMLHGIPIVIKDNFDTADMPTTGASIALAGMVPPDDAEQVKRLRDAGAIIIGKTNLHELAAGITTISSLGGQTRNPYDPARNPGGSSGGTSAAVAASFAALGWGSDTCGSIRIPAAQTSLFGLRPTKGLTSTDGVIPLSHTQDVAGPLARTATDLAIGLDVVVSADASMLPAAARNGRALPRFIESLDATALRGARLGVLRAHFGTSPEEDVVNAVIDNALDEMRANGATVIDIQILEIDTILEQSSVISYEFKNDLIDYLQATPNAPVKSIAEILERGLYHVALEERLRLRDRLGSRDSDEYRAALDLHGRLRAAVAAAFDAERLDAIVYPTIRREAGPVGEQQRGSNCQLSASTGFPALTVPAGFTVNGLPVGLELLGRAWSDARLLALGFSFELATRHRRPPVFTPPLPSAGSGQRPPVELTATAANGTRLRALLTWDPLRGTLDHDVTIAGVSADRVFAVTIERGDEAHGRGVIHRLSGPGVLTARGIWTPPASERTELLAGELVIAVYTGDHPTGAVRVRIPVYR